MYRLLVPSGMAALVAGVMVFGAQDRVVPQPAGQNPPPAVQPKQGAIARDNAIDGKQASTQRKKRCRVYLGVMTCPVEDMGGRMRRKLKLANDDGVFVEEVVPDSPAQEAGLKQGDVITHVNGKLVDDEDELCKDLEQLGPGKAIELTVYREGKKQTMRAALEEIPAQHSGLYNEGPGNDELREMCLENVMRIELLERKIQRLEKRLGDREMAPPRRGKVE